MTLLSVACTKWYHFFTINGSETFLFNLPDPLGIKTPDGPVRGFGYVLVADMSTLLDRACQLQALVMQWPGLPVHEDQGTCCNGNDSHEDTQS